MKCLKTVNQDGDVDEQAATIPKKNGAAVSDPLNGFNSGSINYVGHSQP